MHLDGSIPVKFGLRLNMDEKYKGLTRQLSEASGIPAAQILLVEVFGSLVKVSPECVCMCVIVCVHLSVCACVCEWGVWDPRRPDPTGGGVWLSHQGQSSVCVYVCYCVCASVCVCAYVCECMCVCFSLCVCVCVCVCVCASVCVCACVCEWGVRDSHRADLTGWGVWFSQHG